MFTTTDQLQGVRTRTGKTVHGAWGEGNWMTLLCGVDKRRRKAAKQADIELVETDEPVTCKSCLRSHAHATKHRATIVARSHDGDLREFDVWSDGIDELEESSLTIASTYAEYLIEFAGSDGELVIIDSNETKRAA